MTGCAQTQSFGGWHFVAPTMLIDVPADAGRLRQEILGPVAPLVRWTDEEELLRSLNRTGYGLAAYVYSGKLQIVVRIGAASEVGMVGINRVVVSDPSALTPCPPRHRETTVLGV